MSFILEHTRLGFCWLDLIALAVLVVVVVVFVVQRRKLVQQEKDLEDQLSTKFAENVVDTEPKE